MLLCLLLALAVPSPQKELTALESAYDDTEFEAVITKGNRLLKRELSEVQKKRVHELLAFSYFYLGKKEFSETELRTVLDLDESATIDRKKVTPELGQFYDDVRLRWVQSKQPTVIGAAPEQTLPTEPPVAPASEPVRPKFRAVTLIPFGIGQLAIGDYAAGVSFLAIDIALVTASIALYWVRQSERVGNAPKYVDPARANAMQIAQNVSAFALIGVGIIGFIDALAFSPGRMAASETVRVQASVAPAVGGATVGVAGSF